MKSNTDRAININTGQLFSPVNFSIQRMATACKQLTKDEHEIRTRMTRGLFFTFHKECCRLNLDAYSIMVLLIHAVRQNKMADGTLKQGVTLKYHHFREIH